MNRVKLLLLIRLISDLENDVKVSLNDIQVLERLKEIKDSLEKELDSL